MGKKQAASTTHLKAEDVATLKAALEEERTRILSLYASDLRSGMEAYDEGGDEGDRASTASTRELMYSLSSNEREQYRQIEEAIERIDLGNYGICLFSGDPIPYARLEALPWARYSADTQEKIEAGIIDPSEL